MPICLESLLCSANDDGVVLLSLQVARRNSQRVLTAHATRCPCLVAHRRSLATWWCPSSELREKLVYKYHFTRVDEWGLYRTSYWDYKPTFTSLGGGTTLLRSTVVWAFLWQTRRLRCLDDTGPQCWSMALVCGKVACHCPKTAPKNGEVSWHWVNPTLFGVSWGSTERKNRVSKQCVVFHHFDWFNMEYPILRISEAFWASKCSKFHVHVSENLLHLLPLKSKDFKCLFIMTMKIAHV